MYRAIKLESLPRGALIESTVLRRPPQPSILGAAVVVMLRLSQWQFSGAIKKKKVLTAILLSFLVGRVRKALRRRGMNSVKWPSPESLFGLAECGQEHRW